MDMCNHNKDLGLLRSILFDESEEIDQSEQFCETPGNTYCSIIFSRRNHTLWNFLDDKFSLLKKDILYKESIRKIQGSKQEYTSAAGIFLNCSSPDQDVIESLCALKPADIKNVERPNARITFWEPIAYDPTSFYKQQLGCNRVDDLRCGQGYAFCSQRPEQASLDVAEAGGHVFAIVKLGKFLYWIQGNSSSSPAFAEHTPNQWLDVEPNIAPDVDTDLSRIRPNDRDLEAVILRLWKKNGNVLNCPRGRTLLLKRAINDNYIDDLIMLFGEESFLPQSISRYPMPFFTCTCKCSECCNCGCTDCLH